MMFLFPMRKRRRGSAIIGVVTFILIVSILLMGVGTLCASHQVRALDDANYAAAMDLAEAGVNYEFRKISNDASSANQQGSKLTQTLGPGSFTVWCTATDGGNWTPGSNNLVVWATGTVGIVSRTIKVSGKGYAGPADYAVFALNSGTFNGSAMDINGDVGTNGQFNFNGHPGVTGSVNFNGPGSGWSGGDPGGYSENFYPNSVPWPTVDQIALGLFPGGGLAWLATHNDNSLCSDISGSTISGKGNSTVTLVGKASGAHYYLTSMDFAGNAKLSLNNTPGPIYIWIGPSGGSGTCKISGGVAAVAMSSDPTKAVRLYCGTTTGVTLSGNCNFDGGIYSYNTSGGSAIGEITNNGTPTVNGSILAPTVTLNGNPTINHVNGYFTANVVGYYGYNNSWVEVNLPNFR